MVTGAAYDFRRQRCESGALTILKAMRKRRVDNIESSAADMEDAPMYRQICVWREYFGERAVESFYSD
jgi:hypothetical protein